jgi:hypothetical protein
MSVVQSEELAVELGQASTVLCVDRGVKQDGVARHVASLLVVERHRIAAADDFTSA